MEDKKLSEKRVDVTDAPVDQMAEIVDKAERIERADGKVIAVYREAV